MILRLTTPNKQLVICSASSIVTVQPNLKGSKVTTSNGNFDVLESVEEVFTLWHDSCTNSTNSTNSTNIVAAETTTPITTNTNSTNSENFSAGVVGDSKVLLINNMPIPVDPSTTSKLFDYCKANEPLLKLFGYWMELYEAQGGEVSMVSAIDLGTLAKVVRTGAIDKAMAVFDWVFKSEHYRAEYLRSKGMVNPAVVVSTTKLNANYALAQQKPLPALPPLSEKASKALRMSFNADSFNPDGSLRG